MSRLLTLLTMTALQIAPWSSSTGQTWTCAPTMRNLQDRVDMVIGREAPVLM